MTLPVNIDASYADSPTDASVQLHQQYHDALHADHNALGALARKNAIAVPGDVTATGAPSAATFLSGAGAWAAAPTATTNSVGSVQLAGDLAGTAAAPTVPGLASKASVGQAQAALSLSAVVRSGAATVANSVLPPGVRIGYATTLNTVVVRVGTAPTGSALTVRVNLDAAVLGTVSVPAGATSATLAINVAATAGQIVTYDITAIGSTVAGSDIAVDVVGA